MGMVSIEQIFQWSQGSWLAFHGPATIAELVIDSRRIKDANQALFIAIGTERRDGHTFIGSAYEKGIRNFLVDQQIRTDSFPDANFILVKNTLQALQLIVSRYRERFSIPIIGITGSNGKTIVKEWLFQLLSGRFNIVRSPKSYNSQVGVPLSVWLMDTDNTLGIFEAGISQPGEMERLEKIIQPTLGVFTNIGEAHSEGFLNLRQKIREKLVLFRHVKQLVYCTDHADLKESILWFSKQVRNDEEPLKLFTWSRKHDADLSVREVLTSEHDTTISAVFEGRDLAIQIPFTDPASIENAIHCWCVLLLTGIPEKEISEGMKALHPVAMRLELRHGINDCTIINDTYNSDLTSLQIALDFLEQQKQHRQHTVILSDMLQIGKPDPELYEDVAKQISLRSVQRFIGVGPALYKHRSFFKGNKRVHSIFFKTTDEFLQKFHLLSFEKEAILLKGARTFRFEKLGLLLEQKVHQTVLSINLSALTHNFNVFRSRLRAGTKTMAMVKASSYGSGSFEIGSLLQYAGVDYLAVAYTDEGVGLRKAGITMPIMVMSPDIVSFDRMIAWRLEPEIYNFRSLYSFLDMASTLKVNEYPVHIKLDTGMHRLGFESADIERLSAVLAERPQVRVASIFSHLVASEDASFDSFTKTQSELFTRLSDQLTAAIGYKPLRHLSNSAAVGRHPSLQFDLVRLGLGLYGIDSSGALQGRLRQIGTLKTTVAQIKTVPAGDSVGYGRKATIASEARIATVCIGYADGYPRSLGNGKAYMLIHGQKAPLVGVVCMDMCMVDVSAIPEVQEGDEVVVFGPDLPITSLASWAGTISYEIMTGISQRVKRVYVNEE